MRKRNLTIVLALLAALALVFAAGCDDGSSAIDDSSSTEQSGGNGESSSNNNSSSENGSPTDYTSAVSGKSFTYTIAVASAHNSYRTTQFDETYLNSVVLSFSETTNAVEVKVEYLVCDYDAGRTGGTHGVYYLDTTYTATITTATYTYTVDNDNGDTVTVTLPESAGTLTFDVTKTDGAVTALAIDDDDGDSSCTVKGTDSNENADETGIDLFDGSNVKGALADETSFSVQS